MIYDIPKAQWIAERWTTPQEFKEFQIRSRVFPIMLHIDVTNACDKGCKFCSAKEGRGNDYMTIETFQRVFDEAWFHHGSNMILNLHMTGEPLMHPELFEFLKIAEHMDTGICTGGAYRVRARRVAHPDYNLNRLTVSVSDEASMGTVERLMKMKKRGPQIIAKIFSECFEDPADDEPSPIPFADAYIMGNLRKPGDRTVQKMCYHTMFNPAVTWDGKLVACCADHTHETAVGSIYDESILSLWQKLRGRTHDLCRKCV